MKVLAFLFFLGFSVIAFAGGEQFYTGVQLGRSKIDSASVSATAQSAPLQSEPGVLVSGPAQVGIDDDGFAGRAYAGLQFSPYLSIEGGYTQYASVKIKNIYGIAGKDAQLNEGAIDTVFKVTLPLADGMSIYGKGGEAFVMTNQLEDGYVSGSSGAGSIPDSASYSNESLDRFRPTYGMGVNYDVTRFMSTNFSFARVVGGCGVPTSDLIALGISFYLPNK